MERNVNRCLVIDAFSPAHGIRTVISWAPVKAKPKRKKLIDVNIFLPTGQWSVVSVSLPNSIPKSCKISTRHKTHRRVSHNQNLKTHTRESGQVKP